MSQKSVAKLSALLTIAMMAAALSVWSASLAPAAPSMTVGVDLVSAQVDSATYELVVTNRGAGRSEGTKLSYIVPEGTTLVGSDRSWDLGTLVPGEVRTIPVKLDLDPTRGSHAIVSSARLTDDGDLVSSHTNGSLRIANLPTAPSMCEGASQKDVTTAAGRKLTGGLPLAKVWDWSIDCSNPINPRQATAAQTVGPPTCIDVDPEVVSTPASNKQRLDALVTDGTATNRLAAGEDSCSGNPVSNVNVIWTIEDDDPDSYFSDIEVFPTSGQPNSVTSVSDSGANAGKTYVFVKKVSSGAGASPNRISGLLEGKDVPEEPTTPQLIAQC